MRIPRTTLSVSVPFLLLTALASVELLWNANSASGTGLMPQVNELCSPSSPANSSLWQEAESGVTFEPASTGLVCKLTTIFVPMIEPYSGYVDAPPARTFWVYFCAYIPIVLTVFSLSLHHLSALYIAPIAGLFYSVLTAGVVVTFLCACAADGTPPRRGGPGRKLTRVDVEGLLGGIWGGFVVLQVACLWWDNVSMLIVATLFFVWVYAIQRAWYTISGACGRPTGGSPKTAFRLLLASMIVLQLVVHLPLLAQHAFGHPTASLKDIFFPTSSPFNPHPLSIADGALRWLQYDFIFTYVALLAFLVWRFDSADTKLSGGRWVGKGGWWIRKAVFGGLLVGVSILLGPGTSLVGGWWWNEERGWSDDVGQDESAEQASDERTPLIGGQE